MILHTIIVRGSLILAEFSDSEDDYTTTIKKRMIEVKNTQEDQKILKDNLYLYAVCHQDLKIISLSKDDDDHQIFNILHTIKDEAQNIVADGNYSATLTQLLNRILKKNDKKQIQEEQIDQPILINKHIEKKSSVDFQKKLCLSVTLLILSVFIILNNIIQNE